MTDESKILVGSFKEIPIRIRSGSVTGGRKFVKKEFPNRDTQTIEDLGLQPRSYQLEIIISDRGKTPDNLTPKEDYFQYRDKLLAAIEAKGPGVLIHPLYGRIENVVATTLSINENFSAFGESILSVSFEVNDSTGIPVLTVTDISQLSQERANVVAAVTKSITDNYSVTTKFLNNFQDAKDKVTEVIDTAVEATSFIGAAADEINEFNSFIGQTTANINSLVVDPQALAQNVSNLFSNINGLFSTTENTAKAFQGMFGFGGGDEDDVNTTTAGLTERKQNRGVLNRAINAQALGYAYVAVSQIEFETVAEIEAAEAALNVQYSEIVDNSITDSVTTNVSTSQAVNDSLTDMRVVVQSFFDAQRISAKQVISVFTPETSARLLSFQYYGNSESADEIIALNAISEVSFVSGDVDILTA